VPCFSFAQNTNIERLNQIKGSYQYRENREDFYNSTEGSPYIDKDFYPGKLRFNNQEITGIQLRYNYYEECFEIKQDGEIKLIDPQLNQIDTASILDRIFVAVNYYQGNAIHKSFMELVRKGKTNIYIRKYIKLQEAKEPSAYQQEEPARFMSPLEEVYIQTGTGAAVIFKGKRSITEAFPDHHDELKKYIKQNRLRLKSPEEISQLCDFYDELN
jgi:hypothetical protein